MHGLKLLAANTRDPVAGVVFTVLFVAGMFGVIPEDVTGNEMAELVGLVMGPLAVVFSWIHHKDFKRAIQAGMQARADAIPEDVDPSASTSPDGV